MEQGSFRNGIGCTTMLTTTIWEIQIRTLNMPVRFSEGPVSTLTLVGEEQDDPQRRQVRHFNSTNNTFTHSSAKSAEPLDTTICSSVFGRLPCLNSFLCFLCHFCRKKKKKKSSRHPYIPISIISPLLLSNPSFLTIEQMLALVLQVKTKLTSTKQLPAALIRFHSMFLHLDIFLSSRSPISAYPLHLFPPLSLFLILHLFLAFHFLSPSRSLAFFCSSPQFRISILPASDASSNSIPSSSS